MLRIRKQDNIVKNVYCGYLCAFGIQQLLHCWTQCSQVQLLKREVEVNREGGVGFRGGKGEGGKKRVLRRVADLVLL